METFLEILKYTLPSGIVFLTAYLIMKKYLDNEYRKLMAEIRMNNQKQITPIRLQAYERMTLLLERTSLKNLVPRVFRPGITVKTFQNELIKNIRAEYDHNIAQQIYVSKGLWQAIQTAKEENIKIINTIAAKLPEDASAMQLSQAILEFLMKVEKTPTQAALNMLKKEIRVLF